MTPLIFPSTLGRQILALGLVLLPAVSAAQSASDLLAPVEHRMAQAEASLRAGEYLIAESRYRDAIFEAWMLAGAAHVAADRLTDARDAFRRAEHAVAGVAAARRSLALVQLQMGETGEAVAILTRLTSDAPRDLMVRRLLAQALVADGQPAEAVQTLEEARSLAPDDPELAFVLAAGYLETGRKEAAKTLFAEVAAERPGPQTLVLIGRTYRDFLVLDEARAAFTAALAQDPSARRAHYYLGTLALMSEGDVPIEVAIREFQAELALAPDDPATNLQLGMALAEARRHQEALAPLAAAARQAPSSVAFHHLGQSQLALGNAVDATVSLRRALALADGDAPSRVRRVHYQLALALRETGAADEAARHFDEAKSGSERQADAERERLARYLDEADTPASDTAARLALDSPLAAATPETRKAVAAAVSTVLARAYLNLGIMRAQTKDFLSASAFLADAADIDPTFPNVQFALGTAHFNAKQYDAAVVALTRAREADPGNIDAARLLALAAFNAGDYRQAAGLLANDPSRQGDPSLQYTYGLALVRSGRSDEAETVFTRMLSEHGDRAEIHVILGQAHAQQGNFDAAIESLERARRLDANVPDAGATLGLIHLKQGQLAEARRALEAELRQNAGHALARHTLATVLDLEGRSSESLPLLRSLLQDQPNFADARYLLGKILLAQGAPERALPHLEAAVRLDPDEASYHYQLSQAYRRLAQVEAAERHLAIFQRLKNAAREEPS